MERITLHPTVDALDDQSFPGRLAILSFRLDKSKSSVLRYPYFGQNGGWCVPLSPPVPNRGDILYHTKTSSESNLRVNRDSFCLKVSIFGLDTNFARAYNASEQPYVARRMQLLVRQLPAIARRGRGISLIQSLSYLLDISYMERNCAGSFRVSQAFRRCSHG